MNSENIKKNDSAGPVSTQGQTREAGNKYSLLIFDWDGTLMDSMHHIVGCVQAIAKDFGVTTPSMTDVRKYMGSSSIDFVHHLFPKLDAVLATECFHKHYLAKEANEKFFDGAIETLRGLKTCGYKCAIATNKSRFSLQYTLTQTKLEDLFVTLRCGDDQVCKPDPEVIWSIMRDIGVTHRETLMIGDTEYDMQTAVSAGVDAVAAGYGLRDKELLLAYNPVACIADIAELKSVLRIAHV